MTHGTKPRVLRLPMAIVLVLAVLVLAPHQRAAADHAQWGHAPFQEPFADSASHKHASSETTDSHWSHWNHYMLNTFLQDYDPTDLITIDGGRFGTVNIDVDWYVTAQWNMSSNLAAGNAWCIERQSSTVCSKFGIKISESTITQMSVALKWNLACHEIGHTVGFRDGGTASTSCMDGGNNGVLGTYERRLINDRY